MEPFTKRFNCNWHFPLSPTTLLSKEISFPSLAEKCEFDLKSKETAYFIYYRKSNDGMPQFCPLFFVYYIAFIRVFSLSHNFFDYITDRGRKESIERFASNCIGESGTRMDREETRFGTSWDRGKELESKREMLEKLKKEQEEKAEQERLVIAQQTEKMKLQEELLKVRVIHYFHTTYFVRDFTHASFKPHSVI